MSLPIDIRPRDLDIVRLLLERHLPKAKKIYVFGSRANWSTKDGSDLDLAVDAGSPIPRRDLSVLADALEESDLPYKVDVVDLQTVSDEFLTHIRETMINFPESMPSDNTPPSWRRLKLGEFIELKRGYDLPRESRQPGSIPLVSSSGISDYVMEAKVQGPGVVTGRYGTIGEVFFIDKPFWPLNTTLYVRDFKGNDPRFVSFLLKTVDFLAYSDKAAVPGLNRNHLHEAVVWVPTDIEHQKTISAILGSLEDKIALNRRTNETLEAMARAIFKDWFVDFGPVRAKAEGRAPYLAPEIWSLFPNALDDEGKPEGWCYMPISGIATLCRGGITPGEYPEEAFDHYSIPAFDADGMPKVEHGADILSNKTVVQSGSVLLSKLNPEIPRVWLPGLTDRRAICSTEFLVFKPIGVTCIEYLYCLFSDAGFTERLSGMVTGTSKSHQRVQPHSVLGMEVVSVPANIMREFYRMVAPIMRLIAQMRLENSSLSETRDYLLPKLMSGEIRVKDAENLIQQAV
jgi:type I restriction enzyme, S subunit